ncbi:hypothetical protein [Rhodococcus sp. O3]|uniref:hypothetical protein n=1 Tax=Rhodococcus sp. O3 TaxID=3404919 RepID=UPI003B676677
MTGKQDPSLWEMLGLDRNDTIPVLLEELWERILEIATDPDTPEIGIDLIPDDDIDIGNIDDDDLDSGSILLGDDTDTDPLGSHGDYSWTGVEGLEHDGLDPGAHDATLDPGTGSDDLAF